MTSSLKLKPSMAQKKREKGELVRPFRRRKKQSTTFAAVKSLLPSLLEPFLFFSKIYWAGCSVPLYIFLLQSSSSQVQRDPSGRAFEPTRRGGDDDEDGGMEGGEEEEEWWMNQEALAPKFEPVTIYIFSKYIHLITRYCKVCFKQRRDFGILYIVHVWYSSVRWQEFSVSFCPMAAVRVPLSLSVVIHGRSRCVRNDYDGMRSMLSFSLFFAANTAI